MSDQRNAGDYVSGTVTGNNSGQVAIGSNIAQTNQVWNGEPVTDEERAELHAQFERLRGRIVAEAPGEQQAPALERLEELEQAITADEPDLTTVQYVKRWFLRRLPSMAGLVTAVLVNPIVGKLVQAAGDTALAELTSAVEA